jgi:hypothetical protein
MPFRLYKLQPSDEIQNMPNVLIMKAVTKINIEYLHRNAFEPEHDCVN